MLINGQCSCIPLSILDRVEVLLLAARLGAAAAEDRIAKDGNCVVCCCDIDWWQCNIFAFFLLNLCDQLLHRRVFLIESWLCINCSFYLRCIFVLYFLCCSHLICIEWDVTQSLLIFLANDDEEIVDRGGDDVECIGFLALNFCEH
jgi:hypothetical protein